MRQSGLCTQNTPIHIIVSFSLQKSCKVAILNFEIKTYMVKFYVYTRPAFSCRVTYIIIVFLSFCIVTSVVVKPCVPLLDAPTNGKKTSIEADGITKHIFFSCNPNYVLNGVNLATCNNGTWSSSTPTCDKW